MSDGYIIPGREDYIGSGQGKIQIKLKPENIRVFYCRVCMHQYTEASNTTMAKHVETFTHLDHLLKAHGCLL